MSTNQKNVVMEQRADIRAFFAMPLIRDMVKSGEGGGIHVNMIGPIHITHENGTEEHGAAVIEIEGVEVGALPVPQDKGPLLLRGIEQGKASLAPQVDEKTMKKFEPIYEKLPEPKLDSAVRMVVEMAHRKDSSPQNVAKALNCSLYKAKSVMAKFGLSS